ncbi:MAG: ribulose-phosphate 3-epimerase [Leptospiraceae bacterium]|nr:ribulose-phosphate 3-epimerase [Leptospiraceae bacterium]
MKISPSILAGDLTNIRHSLDQMDPAVVDFIHLDIMDGHFVPALTFGERYAAQIKAATAIPLDVHLMVSRPEIEVPKYFALQPAYITFHIEATHFGIRLARLIREQGIGCGVSLNPGTPVERLEPLLDEIDLVLLMSVEPGFYGQKFIESSYQRLQKLRAMIQDRPVVIEVDGGVGTDNIADLARAGAGIAVAGSACFKGTDLNQNVLDLKAAAAL